MKRAPIALLAWSVPLLLAPTAAAQCPEDLREPRTGLTAVGVEDRLLVAGGDLVEIYDEASGSWSLATLSVARNGIGAASVGARAYLLGGYTDLAPTPTAAIDVYDAATGQWSTDALQVARFFAVAARAGDRLVVLGGGTDGNDGTLEPGPPTIEILDMSSGTWTTAMLPPGTFGCYGAASVGTRAFFGIEDPALPGHVLVYDGATDTFSSLMLPTPRRVYAVASVGSRVLFAGGATYANPAVPVDLVDVYDAATNMWSTSTMPRPRSHFRGVSVARQALFPGGVDGTGQLTESLFSYDATTGAWSEVPLPFGVFQPVGVTATERNAWLVPREASDEFPPPPSLALALPATFPKLYCYGDGTGASCPCGNDSGPGAGCANSTGAGARLTFTGWSCLDDDDLVFTASELPVGQLALLFSGEQRAAGGAGVSFGDGLRCAAGSLRRIALETADAGGAAEFGPGLAAQEGWQPGDVLRLQTWYRDPTGPCASTFNTTNGVEMELDG